MNKVTESPASIAMHAIESSNIAEVGYDPASRTLGIRFKARQGQEKGDLWHYVLVPAEQFQAMMAAPSIGSHFSKMTRPRFNGKKIES